MALFASDYDGTLFRDQHVSQDDLNAIHAFRESGHQFGIATGRPIDSIMHEINHYKIPVDFVVANNGGVVLDRAFEELFIAYMDLDAVQQMLAVIRDFGVKGYGLNDGYYSAHQTLNDVPLFPTHIELRSVSEILEARNIGTLAVWTESEAHAHNLSAILNEQFASANIEAYPNRASVDIGVRGVSKATGLKLLQDHYQIDGPIYAIGDSYNDVPMLTAFHGFLMADGALELEPQVKAVCSSVGQALQSLLSY